MADEKPKEGVKTESSEHINLKVAGQDGSVVQFKIKRHTPLSKLMKAYCERQCIKTYYNRTNTPLIHSSEEVCHLFNERSASLDPPGGAPRPSLLHVQHPKQWALIVDDERNSRHF
ncbi:hypothetical protein NHX12_031726 [Muraenolepis orangiensis]|uniref:Rad60/SUMO-like domain-containing protein n=1 Tax=Muraenolepis orangiensis TaxID=630683 RepID=A0A9Q0E7K2_9TELE|nr:hypothetical protein NHX12_031726 [Muraenolepis orangiensis]